MATGVSRRLCRLLATSVACVFFSGTSAAIELDAGFQDLGDARVSFGNAIEWSTGVAIDTQSGKIVLAGRVDFTNTPGVPSQWLGIAKLDADGAPDTAFDGDGSADGRMLLQPCQGIGSSLSLGGAAGKNIAVQLDGKIVLVASCGTSLTEQGVVMRLLSNGAYDDSFGTNGLVFLPANSLNGLRLNSVALQADGGILAGGHYGPNTTTQRVGMVTRLLADGDVDTEFGANGVHTTAPGGLIQIVRVMPDQRVVIGGSTGTSNSNFLIERLMSDGELDATFNGTGTLDYNVGPLSSPTNTAEPSQDYCFDIAVYADGSVLCVGSHDPLGAVIENALVAKFTSAGALDTLWGTGGYFSPAAGTPSQLSQALSVALRTEGDAIIVGASTPATQVAVNGQLIGTFGLEVSGWAQAVQADGKVLVAALTSLASPDFLAKRFVLDPAPDTTPDAFSFSPVTDTAFNTVVQSATLQITGLSALTPLSISGGEFSLGCDGRFLGSSAIALVANGATVCLRHTTGGADGITTTTTLTVGGVIGTFSSTTGDSIPDVFGFVDATGVARSTVTASAALTINGLTIPSVVSIVGGEYSIGCDGTFTAANGYIGNGQIVCVRHASSSAYSTVTASTLTVGGVSDTFTSTTLAEPVPTPVNPGGGANSGNGGGGSLNGTMVLLLMLGCALRLNGGSFPLATRPAGRIHGCGRLR